MRIPVFVITWNRFSVLHQSLESFTRYIDSPWELVIHDNHSDYPPMIEYLQNLEKNGVKVYWNHRNGTMPEMVQDLRGHIRDWLSKNPASHYVVTDPDIELCGCQGDILPFYQHLLNNIPDIQVVGPMLRLDDIPAYYPLRDHAIQRHSEHFWNIIPQTVHYNNRYYHVQVNNIDTTFGMYRANFPFKNENTGLRTYAPYMARHLDWYIDPDNMTEDQALYLERCNSLAHWGGNSLKNKLRQKPGAS